MVRLDYEFYAWLLVFPLIVLGMLLSVMANDWVWFARIGSLIVIVGVLLASYDLEKLIRKDIDGDVELLKDHAKSVGDDPDEIDENSVPNDYSFWIEKHLKSQLQIIVLGTLIWGFGDLGNKIF